MKERTADVRHLLNPDDSRKKLIYHPGIAKKEALPAPKEVPKEVPPAPVVEGAKPFAVTVEEAAKAVENAPEKAKVPEAKTTPYDAIHAEWKQKNAYHKATEGLAMFIAEGGAELVAEFGAQKVADGLSKFLERKNSVDRVNTNDNTYGLYMMIRALQPNLRKRAELYDKMEKRIDDAVAEYEQGYDALTTKEERLAYQAAHGGNYAPTAGSAKLRKAHIADYRTFDRNAFSFAGGVTKAFGELMEAAGAGKAKTTGAKPAIRELQGYFRPAELVNGVMRCGTLEKYMAERLVLEEGVEKNLEELKNARLTALREKFQVQHDAIKAEQEKKLDAIAAEERVLFGDHPFLASKRPEIVAQRELAEEELENAVTAIELERRVAVRGEFPDACRAIDALRSDEKKETAWTKTLADLRRAEPDRMAEIEAPFEARIEALEAVGNLMTARRVIPESDAVKAAREVFKRRRAEVARETEELAQAIVGNVPHEIRLLNALNVKKDK